MRPIQSNDGNGAVDKWETYAGGALAVMALDTSGRGKPDRRLEKLAPWPVTWLDLLLTALVIGVTVLAALSWVVSHLPVLGTPESPLGAAVAVV